MCDFFLLPLAGWLAVAETVMTSYLLESCLVESCSCGFYCIFRFVSCHSRGKLANVMDVINSHEKVYCPRLRTKMSKRSYGHFNLHNNHGQTNHDFFEGLTRD